MILSIHQPQFLPYLGFWNKLISSDVYVSLDTVQYMNRGFIHRNKVRIPNGWSWLTIPVKYEHGCNIDEVIINRSIDFKDEHLKKISYNYSKSPHFSEYFDELTALYELDWVSLAALDDVLIHWIMEKLNIHPKYKYLSKTKSTGDSTDRIIELCKEFKCDTYLSGDGGKAYMDENLFKENGIELMYQNYQHPTYKQRFDGFEPYMSIIDLLFNHGGDSIEYISNRK